MRRSSISIVLLSLILSVSAWAQTMTGSAAMMGQAPSAKGPDTGSMMAADMGYDALKASGRLADPAVGARLRMAEAGGVKLAFTDLGAAEALAADNPTVLFFAADWCPSCQADLRDINANGSRLGKTKIVVVDYDRSAGLKAMYGITVQDSFVQIGPKGEKLAAWNGGGVGGILDHLRKPM